MGDNSSGTTFVLRTVRSQATGERHRVLVDVGSHSRYEDPTGAVIVESWTAYGPPRHGRWTTGMLGSTFFETNPCDFVPVYRLATLENGAVAELTETPLYREDHPSRYARVANVWREFGATEPRATESA